MVRLKWRRLRLSRYIRDFSFQLSFTLQNPLLASGNLEETWILLKIWNMVRMAATSISLLENVMSIRAWILLCISIPPLCADIDLTYMSFWWEGYAYSNKYIDGAVDLIVPWNETTSYRCSFTGKISIVPMLRGISVEYVFPILVWRQWCCLL